MFLRYDEVLKDLYSLVPEWAAALLARAMDVETEPVHPTMAGSFLPDLVIPLLFAGQVPKGAGISPKLIGAYDSWTSDERNGVLARSFDAIEKMACSPNDDIKDVVVATIVPGLLMDPDVALRSLPLMRSETKRIATTWFAREVRAAYDASRE